MLGRFSRSGPPRAGRDDSSAGPATDRLTLPRGLDAGEVADHEEHVDEPECEPCRPDGKEPDREEDQARIHEQQGVSEHPEAISSTSVPSPLGIVDPAAKR